MAWARGFRDVAGLDEAGRGPLAGPVVAAAIVLPKRFTIEGLDDSKTLSEPERESLYHTLTTRAVSWATGLATAREIDALNILEAARLACWRAFCALPQPPDYALIDAMRIPALPVPQHAIIKGDQLSITIAAASVLAKVTRDRLMRDSHDRFPQYEFYIHKGYPTPRHLELLAAYGPCEEHRRSFRPVQLLSQAAEPAHT